MYRLTKHVKIFFYVTYVLMLNKIDRSRLEYMDLTFRFKSDTCLWNTYQRILDLSKNHLNSTRSSFQILLLIKMGLGWLGVLLLGSSPVRH